MAENFLSPTKKIFSRKNFFFFWKLPETNYVSIWATENFFQNGRPAAILDVADASKTIGKPGQTFPTLSENFSTFGQGVLDLSSGNRKRRKKKKSNKK